MRSPPGAVSAEVNMASLVDVMLVVLVLFMITVPLIPDAPPVTLPEVPADQVPLKDTDVVVIVARDGTVHYRGRDVSRDLEAVLRSDRAVQTSRRLYVRGDREARFGSIASVLATARRAGVEGLNLVVEPVTPSSGTRKR